MAYEVLKLERQNRLTAISGYGAKVIDWTPSVELSQISYKLGQFEALEMATEVSTRIQNSPYYKVTFLGGRYFYYRYCQLFRRFVLNAKNE